MDAALADEAAWCESASHLADSGRAYEACIRILTDLVRLRWRIVEQGYGYALENPKEQVGSRPAAEIVENKLALREELRPVVEEQRRHPAVVEFIRRMEQGDRFGRKSVLLLVASGGELAERLSASTLLEGEERVHALRQAIKPYLQEANDEIDDTTKRSRREIWRYFRYSWSIPQVPTPGRQLLYLVRDAGHPAHPVIGLAALNNCPLEMGETRETFIGWHIKAIGARFSLAVEDGASALEREVTWLEQQIATSLDEIEWANLATPEQIADPDDALIRKLAKRGQDYAQLRAELLAEIAATSREDFDVERWEDDLAPPVDDVILEYEKKASVDRRMHTARKQLVAKKRASALARLLTARRTIAQHRSALIDPRQALGALARDEVRSAIHIILEALKGRRAGANLLEITTCGAIAPYNRLLGGKLVSLLMLSPQLGADYQRAYASPSIISSQMRNKPVTRDNALVYLGTTSLYVHGSSQYNRLSLPAGTISPEQPTIRFVPIGQTSGFGTVQFSLKTSKAIDTYLSAEKNFKDVNSVFGEGTSPKLRKLKIGLRELGFEPDKIIQHRQHRLIYAMPLFEGARDWLLERTGALPEFLRHPARIEGASERIAEFWRARWLASRVGHAPTMAALRLDAFVALGDVAETPMEGASA